VGHLRKSKWKDSNSNSQPLLIRLLQYCSSALLIWWKWISERAKGQCSVRFTDEAECDAVRTCLVWKHIPNQANRKQYEYPSQIHATLQCRRFRYQVRYIQQDRQCTYKYNIKTRSRNHRCCGKAESITYSECVSVACYPARRAHAPYCQLWPVRLYIIFSPLSHKRPVFRGGGGYWSQNVFWFSLQSTVRNISYFKKNSARCYYKSK
jgi:hypothetical protein